MKKVKSILFVCTGNSCRSIMAEGLLKKILSDKKRDDIQVYSCGTIAMSGFSPVSATVAVMKKEGIDVSGYKSTSLSNELIDKSDLIVVMEKMHKDAVINLAPDAEGKVYFLKEFINKEGNDLSVIDPIGKSTEVYERVLGMIKEAVQKLAEQI